MNPQTVDCNQNDWTLVATNVTAGQIHKLTSKPNGYLHTYRMTGGDAPTDKSEGVPIFLDGKISEPISSSAGIDVYIYCLQDDGKVRVDLP